MKVEVQTHGCFYRGLSFYLVPVVTHEKPAVFRHTWVVFRALCTKCHLLCFHNSDLGDLWVIPASLHQIKGFKRQHYWFTTVLLISVKDLLKKKKTCSKCKNKNLYLLPLNIPIRHLLSKAVEMKFPFHPSLCNSPVWMRNFSFPGAILIAYSINVIAFREKMKEKNRKVLLKNLMYLNYMG